MINRLFFNKIFNKKSFIKIIALFIFIFASYEANSAPNYTYTKPEANSTNQNAQNTTTTQTGKVSVDKSVLNNITLADLLRTDMTYGAALSDINAKIAVRQIGTKLKNTLGIDKKIYFVYSKEDKESADTTASGTITIYRGLINLCESEDELAFVIAHELAHAANYHGVKGLGVEAASDIGSKAGSMISDSSSNWILGSLAEIAVKVTTKVAGQQYSKSLENDADILAVDYLAKCGYNPLAGISILYKAGDMYDDLLASHESVENRILNVYSYTKQKYPQYLDSQIDTEAYKAAMDLINTLNRI